MAGRQLVEAAKSAAMKSASSRIDALNERLQGRPVEDEDTAKPVRSTTRRATRAPVRRTER